MWNSRRKHLEDDVIDCRVSSLIAKGGAYVAGALAPTLFRSAINLFACIDLRVPQT